MTSGIYCFKHKEKPYIYIGSSADIGSRYKGHLNAFEKRNHNNITLQEDFLSDKLTFEILCKDINQEDLLNMEEYYCEYYLDNGYLLYNRVLPKGNEYVNVMMCSKENLKNKDIRFKLGYQRRQLKKQDKELQDCYNIIYNLKKEIEVLQEKLLSKNNKVNIFTQIEAYGEIKEGF
jgi:hypothetical protein